MKKSLNVTVVFFSILFLISLTYCSSSDNRLSNLDNNIAPGQTRIVGEISSVNKNSVSKDGNITIDAIVKITKVIQRGSSSTRVIAKGKDINLIFEYPSAVNPQLVVGDKFMGDITEIKAISLNNQDSSPKYLIYVFDKLN